MFFSQTNRLSTSLCSPSLPLSPHYTLSLYSGAYTFTCQLFHTLCLSDRRLKRKPLFFLSLLDSFTKNTSHLLCSNFDSCVWCWIIFTIPSCNSITSLHGDLPVQNEDQNCWKEDHRAQNRRGRVRSLRGGHHTQPSRVRLIAVSRTIYCSF